MKLFQKIIAAYCLTIAVSPLTVAQVFKQITPPTPGDKQHIPTREEFRKNFVMPTDLVQAMYQAAIQGQYTGELNGPLAKKLRESAHNPTAQVLVSFVQDGGKPDCRHFDGKISMPGLNNRGMSPVMKVGFHAGPRGNPCHYEEPKNAGSSTNK